jgi:monoamine oxidase
MLELAQLHDWQADPFARGAYSYIIAGGGSARKALAASVEGTLFFAGEASDTAGESGTVAGALQSGMRAARQVLRG